MRGVRGNVATSGEFRHSQNWIGPPGCTLNDATYIPPAPMELMVCLDDWEKFLQDETVPPLILKECPLSKCDQGIHLCLSGGVHGHASVEGNESSSMSSSQSQQVNIRNLTRT